MVPGDDGFVFWYRVMPTPADPSGMTFAELGVGQQPPLGPRIRLESEGAAPVEAVVSLDQSEGTARLTALPLSETETLWIGFRDGETGEGFFYYSASHEADRGELPVGGSVQLSSGFSLSYEGAEPDTSAQGTLAVGETRRIWRDRLDLARGGIGLL